MAIRLRIGNSFNGSNPAMATIRQVRFGKRRPKNYSYTTLPLQEIDPSYVDGGKQITVDEIKRYFDRDSSEHEPRMTTGVDMFANLRAKDNGKWYSRPIDERIASNIDGKIRTYGESNLSDESVGLKFRLFCSKNDNEIGNNFSAYFDNAIFEVSNTLWEFSADGGNKWMQLYDLPNRAYSRITLPKQTNKIRARALSNSPDEWVQSFAIIPKNDMQVVGNEKQPLAFDPSATIDRYGYLTWPVAKNGTGSVYYDIYSCCQQDDAVQANILLINLQRGSERVGFDTVFSAAAQVFYKTVDGTTTSAKTESFSRTVNQVAQLIVSDAFTSEQEKKYAKKILGTADGASETTLTLEESSQQNGNLESIFVRYDDISVYKPSSDSSGWTAPTKEGYAFAGWYVNESLASVYLGITGTAYAYFVPTPALVDFIGCSFYDMYNSADKTSMRFAFKFIMPFMCMRNKITFFWANSATGKSGMVDASSVVPLDVRDNIALTAFLGRTNFNYWQLASFGENNQYVVVARDEAGAFILSNILTYSVGVNYYYDAFVIVVKTGYAQVTAIENSAYSVKITEPSSENPGTYVTAHRNNSNDYNGIDFVFGPRGGEAQGSLLLDGIDVGAYDADAATITFAQKSYDATSLEGETYTGTAIIFGSIEQNVANVDDATISDTTLTSQTVYEGAEIDRLNLDKN